jgi:hypothetical protein
MTPHIWISAHWFQLLQTIAIIASLLYTAYQIRRSMRSDRVLHMLTITQAHRDIWSKMYDHPELSRIRKSNIDLEFDPVTEAERLFVILLMLHLNCVLELSARGIIVPIEGMEEDARQFFRRPIPQRVWNEIRYMQNHRIVEFVENAINRSEASSRSVKTRDAA